MLKILEMLYEMRLIEKLGRPIDHSTKEKTAMKYADKVTDMNMKLRKVVQFQDHRKKIIRK